MHCIALDRQKQKSEVRAYLVENIPIEIVTDIVFSLVKYWRPQI